MPKINLVEPCLSQAGELLSFEVSNRQFFESHVNARPSSYYSVKGVTTAIESAMEESREDKAYQYLVRSEAGRLVGRVNLTIVRRAHFHSAELGYRIAQSDCGRGHASEAVRQALSKAFAEKGFLRIEAVARPENLGSINVLRKSGFVEFGRSSRSFELAGVRHDRLYFEKHAEG